MKRAWQNAQIAPLALASLLMLTAAPQLVRAQDDELDALGQDSDTAQDAKDKDNDKNQSGASPVPEAEPAAQPKPAPEAEALQPTAASVAIQPFAGAGWTSRSFERPVMLGAQRLPTSFAPAVEVGLRVVAWPNDSFSLAFLLHYQSAVALTVREHPPFALENDFGARSERVELSVAPGWRLGSAARSPRLSVPVGAGMRTFFPAVHNLMTPGYSLIGPQARLEIELPLTSALKLGLGPEVQWIIAIDESLFREGVNSQAVAVGGQVLLELEISATWSLALHYRESHALAGSNVKTSFEDVERYMTVRAQGTF